MNDPFAHYKCYMCGLLVFTKRVDALRMEELSERSQILIDPLRLLCPPQYNDSQGFTGEPM